jgi:ABC-type uncharacterized transport system YnjBCD permease subunit
MRMIVMPTAPTAPAIIAPQWTPEAELSTEVSGTTAAWLAILIASQNCAEQTGREIEKFRTWEK